MSFFEALAFWIELVNAASYGTFLPAVAVVLIALVVCAHLALWERLRRRRADRKARAALAEVPPAGDPMWDRLWADLLGEKPEDSR